MEYDRRRAYGRWAEYVGSNATEQDVVMRRFQIRAGVERDYEAVGVECREMLDAYAAGVNAFIESTDRLPVEYGMIGARPEPWQPWDCMAVFKVRHILMGVFEGKTWRAKLVKALGPEKAAELLKGYQPGHLVIVPPGETFDGPALDGVEELSRGLEYVGWLGDGVDAGSNNWVLAGSRTASGKPLLAGDPHRALDTPNAYYQNHIACPEFDAIGMSFPGCPGFPHFGHNAHVAWCVTHAGADYQDLFLERLRANGGTEYEFKGEWREAEVRREVIHVRGGEPVELNVTVTQHGPVIAENADGRNGIAFRYTATAEPNRGFECMLRMLEAGSADEIDESMREWVDPCNNFLFADVHGNIGYLNRGKVPLRTMANAWLPVPGWTGEHEWQGYIPFEALARSRNPDTGYIVTANNRIVGEDFPYYIALDFAPDYRARRILERVKGMSGASVDDMASVHAERVSILPRSSRRTRFARGPRNGSPGGTGRWSGTPWRHQSTAPFGGGCTGLSSTLCSDHSPRRPSAPEAEAPLVICAS
jgi:penicillin amidase